MKGELLVLLVRKRAVKVNTDVFLSNYRGGNSERRKEKLGQVFAAIRFVLA